MLKSKLRWAALALGAMAALGAQAMAEQSLPGIALFSPGLARLSERMEQHPAVMAEATFTVEDAYYARDLSVLSAMLEGTTFRYDGVDGSESLTIARGDQTLGRYALAGDTLSVNGETAALEQGMGVLSQMTGSEIPGEARLEQAVDALKATPILERVPLTAVAGWLEGLRPGEALAFGFAVTEPVTLEKTMSDDGTRLTRVDVKTGAIARDGETPYTLTGFMRQPAGRAPKDTFELVLTQDDRNFIELSYSALREQTVASKNKKGETTVRTQLKAAGRIAGSSLSSRLTVNLTNAWTADGEALSERVTVSATLSHSDNTPDRDKIRLNDVNVKLRQVFRLTTHDAGDDVIVLTDDLTLEAVMNDQTFLVAGADVRMEIGSEAAEQAQETGAAATPDEAGQSADALMAQAARDLAKAVYPLLDEQATEKAVKGL